jgi:hypothetical protein
MKVAILIGRNNGIALLDRKCGHRLLARLQLNSLIASLGLQGYPLNIMGFGHWMLNRTHGHSDQVPLSLDYRNMLLLGAVSGAWNNELHRLATALDLNARVVDISDDVAANLTYVEFHRGISFPILYCKIL